MACAGPAAQALSTALNDPSDPVGNSYTNNDYTGPPNQQVTDFQNEWNASTAAGQTTGTLNVDGLYGACTAQALSGAIGVPQRGALIPNKGTMDFTTCLLPGPFACAGAPPVAPNPPSAPGGGMPTWAKWLIALLLLGAVGGGVWLWYRAYSNKKLGAGERKRLTGKRRKR